METTSGKQQRNKLPDPPAPRSDMKLWAQALAQAIRSGTNGSQFAELALTVKGMDFMKMAAAYNVEDVMIGFKEDPAEWAQYENIEPIMRGFLAAFIRRAQQMVTSHEAAAIVGGDNGGS